MVDGYLAFKCWIFNSILITTSGFNNVHCVTENLYSRRYRTVNFFQDNEFLIFKIILISDDHLVTKIFFKTRRKHFDSGRKKKLFKHFSHHVSILESVNRMRTANFYPTDMKNSLPLLTLMTQKISNC